MDVHFGCLSPAPRFSLSPLSLSSLCVSLQWTGRQASIRVIARLESDTKCTREESQRRINRTTKNRTMDNTGLPAPRAPSVVLCPLSLSPSRLLLSSCTLSRHHSPSSPLSPLLSSLLTSFHGASVIPLVPEPRLRNRIFYSLAASKRHKVQFVMLNGKK